MRSAPACALAIVVVASSLALIACGDDQPALCLASGGRGGHAGNGSGGSGGVSGASGGAGGATGGVGGSSAGRGGQGGQGGIAGAGRGGSGGSAGAGGGAGAAKGGTGGGSAGSGGATGGSGGVSVPPTPGYTGCSRVGGVDRLTVTKLQTTNGDLCYDLSLWLTQHAPQAGLTLPQGWTMMGAVARPCVVGGATIATPATIAGTVDWAPQIGFNLPPALNLDVTLTFMGSGADGGVPATVRMTGQNIDVRSTCP